MLAEFIKVIADMAKDTERFARIVTADKTEVIRMPDGSTWTTNQQPKPCTYVTEDYDSFIKAITEAGVSDRSLVLVSPASAVAYFDPEFRENSITLRLPKSAAFQGLNALQSWSTQREAVALIRDNLAGCCESGLLPVVRSLDFARRNDGTRSIHHGRESLGKDVETSVQSKAGELQETYQFSVPLFACHAVTDYHCEIACNVDTDATNEKLRFVAIGDQLTIAEQRGVAYVADHIDAETGDAATVIVARE